MALAIKMQGMVDHGEVRDYAELARLAQVTRARMTQIMNFNLLAPELQERLLFFGADFGARCGHTEWASEGLFDSRLEEPDRTHRCFQPLNWIQLGAFSGTSAGELVFTGASAGEL